MRESVEFDWFSLGAVQVCYIGAVLFLYALGFICWSEGLMPGKQRLVTGIARSFCMGLAYIKRPNSQVDSFP